MSLATLLLIVAVASIFLALFLSLAAAGVLTDESRGVSRSLAVVRAYTTAPRDLQEDVEPPFKERVLTPLLDWSLAVGRKLTPDDYVERIRRRLDLAGNPPGWTVDRVTSLKFLGFAAALALSLLAAFLLGLGLLPMLALCVGAAVLGYFSPNLYLYQVGYDRNAAMQRALPDAMDLLTISVEAGLGFDSALAHVARNTRGPLAHELSRVLQEMQIGLGRAQALRALGERTDLPALRSFVSAIAQADSLGIPIGQVLRVQSGEIRLKRRQYAEEVAQKIPVKMLFPLIFCILPTLFIAVLGPAVLQVLDTVRGMFS